MQTIGARLEEARKRKGISLREAAEATKIRSDFLGYIEQDKFEFDLPELYKRGFVRNYARYLKLDPEKIVTDYNAQLLSSTRSGKKGTSELFGQIEITKSASALAVEEAERDNSNHYGRITPNAADHEDRGSDEEEADKTFYLKIGLVFVGTLTLVFVIFGLIKAILSSGDTVEDTPVTPTAEITEPAEPSAPVMSDTSPSDLTLIASGNVYVLIRQQSDGTTLYRDTMDAGETVNLTKDGPVDILFTAGENITIESGGERLRPKGSGTAKITLQ